MYLQCIAGFVYPYIKSNSSFLCYAMCVSILNHTQSCKNTRNAPYNH